MKMIVACDKFGGIGKNNRLPWHIPEDLEKFKTITMGNVIVMGRITYEEIANKFPDRTSDILPGRRAFVISKTVTDIRGAEVRTTLRSIIDDLKLGDYRGDIFIIGGAKLYKYALSMVDEIYMTIVDHDYKCDRHINLPAINARFNIVSGETSTFEDYQVHFLRLNRKKIK